jgi:glycosyltransferase involved in cell wall biosynthesis
MVAGDFVRTGGMDRANHALASYLLSQGRKVHLVSFRVDPELASHPNVVTHLVSRPVGIHSLSAPRLARKAAHVIQFLKVKHHGVRVLVNGTNCNYPDLNWVHFVHNAWYPIAESSPGAKTFKDRIKRLLSCRGEKRQLPLARTLIANSNRTKRDLVEYVGVDESRIHTIYLGANDDWMQYPPEHLAEVRARVRAEHSIREEAHIVLFVGALGDDNRKGYDTLWKAWKELLAEPAWDAVLLVVGGGRALPHWQREAGRSAYADRVKLLGFRQDVPDLLAASDILVSPTRYEAYGLNVQEALVFGLPAIVSASAGVAERYPSELKDLLLKDADDASGLALTMRTWLMQKSEFKRRLGPLTKTLRSYSWLNMAAAIVDLAEKYK